MVETRTNRRLPRGRKKARVPLAKLRTAEVVRTIVAHPRRLTELLGLLDGGDRALRGRAAATLARLAEAHPGRLARRVERLCEGLVDDSAYVRWHLVYALGRMVVHYPVQSSRVLGPLVGRLQDDNRIVRALARQALNSIARRQGPAVRQAFQAASQPIPTALGRILDREAARARVR